MSETRAPGRPAGQLALGITAETLDKFVEGLREHGTFDAAARAARPHLAARGSKHCSVGAFREHARRNPYFASRCEEAQSDFKGEMEALAVKRAKTVDRRPVFGKAGQFLGYEVNRRNANDMLKVVLARVDPSAWAPKKNVTVDATVTHNGGTLTSGAQWVLKPEDILLLENPDDQRALIDLLAKIEDARNAAEVPPEPVHPYGLLTIQPGPTAAPVRPYNAAATADPLSEPEPPVE